MNNTFLLETLENISPLPNKIIEQLTSHLREEHLPKKHLLLKEGQIAKRVYFIQEGLARGFFYHKKKEKTSWFRQAGDFMVSVNSFFTQSQTTENIELVEDCMLYSLSWVQLQALYEDFPEFNLIGRVLAEKYYMRSEERAKMLRTFPAVARYQVLMNQYPQILQRAKLGQIASYLSISQETLSRIRANSHSTK